MNLYESIVEYIYRYSLVNPNRFAVVGTDVTCTYCQLWRQISAVAAILKQNGIKRGDRVMLEASHTAEYVSLLYAIHLTGAVSVPLESEVPETRVQEIAEAIQPRMILLGHHPLENFNVTMDHLPDCSDERWSFPTRDMLQEILFTTGTTGKSKGVMITHGARIQRCIGAIYVQDPLREDSVWLCPVPMNHEAGLARVGTCMVRGNTVVLINGFTDLKKYFKIMSDYKVTAMLIPPAGIHYILSLAAKKLSSFNDQLDMISSSSDVLPNADRERLNSLLPNVKKFNIYGSSEAGSTTCLEYNADKKDTKCVGKPYPGMEVYIVDDNYQRIESSADNPGIIAVKGNSLFSGYLDEPELTKETLQDGVMYLADIGYMENGCLYLVGRRGDVINIGGLKVAPSEVEDVARLNPAIDECVCIPYNDKKIGKILKMYVVLKEGYTFDADDIINKMADKLEQYKIPKLIEQIDSIPRTYNGKIDRKKLISLP